MSRVPGTRRRLPTTYVGLPLIPDSEEPAVKSAMAVRATTWVSGSCPECGAAPEVKPYPELGVAVVSFQHLDSCSVCDVLPSEP